MARRAKPWWWSRLNTYCVTIDGVQHKLGPDKEAAERKFHELMAKRAEERVPSESVVAVFDLFLEWTQKHRESSTYEWYCKHLNSFSEHLTPKDLSVERLKAHHVENWIDSKSWGDSVRRGAMTAVLRALNWAEKKGHIERNPIRGKLDRPQYGKRDRVLSAEELATVLKHARSNFRDVILIAAETGARPQEICKVEARHVDLQQQRWVFKVKESKGKRKERIVWLTAGALEITKRLMEKHPTGPLFLTSHGNPWDRHKISDAFSRLEAKVGVKYRLYDFRFSFCTNGLKKGVDPVSMQHLMGHQDLQMISKVYALVNQDGDHMRKMAEKAVK